MKSDWDKPFPNELPSTYADRLGVYYTSTVTLAHKKKLGQYFTPVNVATFLASFPPKGNHEVNVVSESWAYKESLNDKQTVKITGGGDNKAVLVSVPPYSTGYYIYMTGIIIVCLLPSLIAL